MHDSTLRRRLKGGTSRKAAYIKQQLHQQIEQWVVRVEGSWFPPRISHVQEVIVLLKGGTGGYNALWRPNNIL